MLVTLVNAIPVSGFTVAPPQLIAPELPGNDLKLDHLINPVLTFPDEDTQDGFEDDTLHRRETLELVRAYYKITDPAVRKRLFELTKSLGKSKSGSK